MTSETSGLTRTAPIGIYAEERACPISKARKTKQEGTRLWFY